MAEPKKQLTQRCNDCMAVFDEALLECPRCHRDDCLMHPYIPMEGDRPVTDRGEPVHAADATPQSDRWVIRYATLFGTPWYCRDDGKIAVMPRAEAEADLAQHRRDRLAAGMDEGSPGQIVHADTVDLAQPEEDDDANE